MRPRPKLLVTQLSYKATTTVMSLVLVQPEACLVIYTPESKPLLAYLRQINHQSVGAELREVEVVVDDPSEPPLVALEHCAEAVREFLADRGLSPESCALDLTPGPTHTTLGLVRGALPGCALLYHRHRFNPDSRVAVPGTEALNYLGDWPYEPRPWAVAPGGEVADERAGRAREGVRQADLRSERGRLLLLNAFSANMLAPPSSVSFEEVTCQAARERLAPGFESAVGHEGTAALLSKRLELQVEMRRATVSLGRGERAVIAQYVGPRLPEGATELPEGASLRFLVAKVL